jgi:hypothetical protein
VHAHGCLFCALLLQSLELLVLHLPSRNTINDSLQMIAKTNIIIIIIIIIRRRRSPSCMIMQQTN